MHYSHNGIDMCLRKSRDSLYWLRMTDDIRIKVENCVTCHKHTNNQAKLSMQTHPIPDLPWKRVTMDILSYANKDYLITTDYYSDFREIDQLENLKSETLIEITKKNFSRWIIPITLVTDNDQPFVSTEFRQF